MSVFPLPWQPKRSQQAACSTPHLNLAEQLREAERRCAAAEHELEISVSAIARLSADLDKERARSNEFEQIMSAMGREFAVMNATATDLAQRAGVTPVELYELKQMWANSSADPDHAAVGLHQSAPDFLVRAARTALRKVYHPDTKSDDEKSAAEANFKRNEAAFERLYRARGMSG